jgi:hypothetical protein
MLRRRTHILLAVAALALGTMSFFIQQSEYPLTYDEGDYYRAVQRGLWMNMTDADELPLPQFLRLGFAAIRDPRSRAALSDRARNAGSTMFLRHYHAPLAFYPAIALRPLVRSLPLPAQLRLANLFWVWLWVIVLAVALRGEDAARATVILLLPASTSLGLAVVGFNMHLPFGVLISLFLYFWQRYEESRETRDERLAVLFLAAAVVTVEYGLFICMLLAAWLAWRFVRTSDRRALLHRTFVRAVWMILFLVLLWPAGVLQLNLLRSWAFVAYIALFRLGSERAAFAGWQELVFGKWNASPVELLLMAALLVWACWQWRRTLTRGSTAVAVGFILALFLLQRSPALVYRWYLFPAFAVAFLGLARTAVAHFAARSAERRSFGYLTFAVPVLAVAMFLVSTVVIKKPAYPEIERMHAILRKAPQREVVLPRSICPQLLPYFPDRRLRNYHDEAFAAMDIDDSLRVWLPRCLVILPASVPFSMKDLRIERTDNYRIIYGALVSRASSLPAVRRSGLSGRSE